MGVPPAASKHEDDDDSLQLSELNSTLSTSSSHLHGLDLYAEEEEELGAVTSTESAYVISSSSHDLHVSDKNGKRSTGSTSRSAHRQQKVAKRSLDKRLRLALLSSTVPNATECKDEESMVKAVIDYVQGLQKEVKDIKAEIALLQMNMNEQD